MAEDNLNIIDGSSGDNNLPTWMAQNPDDLKSNEVLAQHKTIGDLSRSYLDLHGKSQNAIYIPGENANPEEWSTFYNRLGRPETVEGYELDEMAWPDDVPDYIKERYESNKTDIKKALHEAGISNIAAKKVMKSLDTGTLNEYQAAKQAESDYQNRTVNELKGEWKDQYDGNLETARRGFAKAAELAGIKDDFVKFMEDSRLGDNPMFLKVFYGIGKAISEDSSLGDGAQRATEKTDVDRGADGRPILNFPSMEK